MVESRPKTQISGVRDGSKVTPHHEFVPPIKLNATETLANGFHKGTSTLEIDHNWQGVTSQLLSSDTPLHMPPVKAKYNGR